MSDQVPSEEELYRPCLGRPLSSLRVKIGRKELPPGQSPKRDRRHPLFDVLDKMEVGMSADVDRTINTVYKLVTDYRRVHNRCLRFVVRPIDPTWTRIWRVKDYRKPPGRGNFMDAI